MRSAVDDSSGKSRKSLDTTTEGLINGKEEESGHSFLLHKIPSSRRRQLLHSAVALFLASEAGNCGHLSRFPGGGVFFLKITAGCLAVFEAVQEYPSGFEFGLDSLGYGWTPFSWT